MSSRIDSLPPAIRRVSNMFRITGWASFWAQTVLGVIATLVLLFAGSTLSLQRGANRPNPETGLGLFFAGLALVALFAGAYWAFRYKRLSNQLTSPKSTYRPKPSDAIRLLRIGLFINLGGMLLGIIGAQAIAGSLLAKALVQPQGGGFYTPQNITQFLQSIDIFVVQANTNIIMAHFIGLVASLWLLQFMGKQQ